MHPVSSCHCTYKSAAVAVGKGGSDVWLPLGDAGEYARGFGGAAFPYDAVSPANHHNELGRDELVVRSQLELQLFPVVFHRHVKVARVLGEAR